MKEIKLTGNKSTQRIELDTPTRDFVDNASKSDVLDVRLNNEINRATAAEGALDERIDALETEAVKDVTVDGVSVVNDRVAEIELQPIVDSIEEEKSRAEGMEKSLSDDISLIDEAIQNLEESDERLQSNIDAEKERATKRENEIEDSIDAETARATAREDELEKAIGEAGKIDDVKVDGISVVTDKVANIDLQPVRDSISAEETRAKTAEQQITNNYVKKSGDTMTGKLTATHLEAVGDSSNKYGTLSGNYFVLKNNTDGSPYTSVGFQQYRGKFEFMNPNAIYNFAKPGVVGWQLNLTNVANGDKVVYAQNKSGTLALTSDVDTEASNRKSADTILQSNIDSEVSRAKEAEEKLTTDLSTEATTRETNDNTLQTNIDAESARAKDAEKTLTDDLTAEASTRRTNDETLQSNIDAEAKTRGANDNAIQSNLDAEITRATSKETELEGAISKAGKVDDVQVNGASVVTDKVANIDLTDYVTLSTDQTITGLKTFAAPAYVPVEQATAIYSTSNGGRIILGKSGANSGTMIAVEQKAGTRRLNFRASVDSSAMVWEQPESSSNLYFDVNAVHFRKVTSITFGENSAYAQAIFFKQLKSADYLYTDSKGTLTKGAFDDAPTADSTNPVTSDGIKSYVDSSASDTLTASKAYTDQEKANYVLKSGDTMTGTLNVPTINSLNTSTAVSINVGTNASSYFQARKFRGQGDANTYNHAVDFGYAGHDQIDFYEYGGVFNFWANRGTSKLEGDGNRVASLQSGKILERGNTLTYPGKSGTFALTDDVDAVEKTLTDGLSAESSSREAADTALQSGIDSINSKIPEQASSSNQLADKDYVNSSIATSTATFRGTVDSLDALKELTGDLNDYAFVEVKDETTGLTLRYDRYKYSDVVSTETGNWAFEYTLNNSSFTSDQWKAITSGITSELVAQITTNKNAIAQETADRQSSDDSLQKNIDAEVTRAKNTEQTISKVVNDYINETDEHLGRLDDSVSSMTTSIDDLSKKEAADVLNIQTSLATEIDDRENADSALQSNIDAEADRAKAAEETLAKDLTDYVTLDTDQTITGEKTIANDFNTQSILPISAGTYSLGSDELYYRDLYLNNITIPSLSGEYKFVFKATANGVSIGNADYKGNYMEFIRTHGYGISLYNTLEPSSDDKWSLGAENYRFKDLYLSGNISDRTNSITVADIVAKQDALTAGDNITITDATIAAKDTTYSIDTAAGNTITLTGSDGTSLTKTINDVSHASSTDSATALANAPSLLTSGNTVAVRAGEKTSSYITVPYAASAGSATKATKDGNGKVISSTYLPSANVNNVGTLYRPVYFTGTAAKAVSSVESTYLGWVKTAHSGLTAVEKLIWDGGANIFANVDPKYVDVEYSNDGGATWVDSGLSDDAKIKLFLNEDKARACVGKANTSSAHTMAANQDKLRITMRYGCGLYYKSEAIIFKYYFPGNVDAVVSGSSFSDTEAFTEISSLTCGGNPWFAVMPNDRFMFGNNQVHDLRIEFTFVGPATSYLTYNYFVCAIRGYSSNAYSWRSDLGKTGVLYTTDSTLKATFPAAVAVKGGESTQFMKADGSLDSTEYQVKLSDAQQAAVDSGMTLSLAKQISTNQSDILSLGAKLNEEVLTLTAAIERAQASADMKDSKVGTDLTDINDLRENGSYIYMPK